MGYKDQIRELQGEIAALQREKQTIGTWNIQLKEKNDRLFNDLQKAKENVKSFYLSICDACGKAELTVVPSRPPHYGQSQNYPRCCGAGGSEFVKTELVAVWRPSVEWRTR